MKNISINGEVCDEDPKRPYQVDAPGAVDQEPIIFAGPLFARKLNDPANLLVAVQIFLVFGLVSSASYMLNDIMDRKEDSHHPEKKRRP